MFDTSKTNQQLWNDINDRAANAIYCFEDSDVDRCLALIDDDYLGVDTETTGFDPYGNVEIVDGKHISRAYIRLLTIEGNGQCVLFDLKKLNFMSIDKICQFIIEPERVLVMQNAKFDMKWMLALLPIEKFNRVFDTMVASQLLSAGKVKFGHSLKAIVKFYFNEEMDKELGGSDWKVDTLSKDQLFYGALDTCVLKPIREMQVERLKKMKLVEAADIEFKCIETVAYMELCGIRLNGQRWLRNANRNKIRAIRMEEKVSKALQAGSAQTMLFDNMATFKVSSTMQLTKAMKAAGIQLPTKYEKGVEKETTQIEYLEKVKDQHPAIPVIIKYASLKKAHTSYGQTYIDKIHPITGRLHPDIFQIGTETYRFAFKEPNLQQIPVENIFRNCFIPDPGNKLIGGDYNAMELRLIAQVSQDQQMLMAFNKGLDLHTYTASIVFKVPYEKMMEVLSNKKLKDYTQYKIYRTRAKNLNFGIVYGIGARRFAANADITEQEAYQIIDEYFALYEGLKNWLDWAKKEARFNKVSRSLSGRMIKHTHKDGDDKGIVAASERLGTNFPIQASNADITKIALRNIYDEFGRKVKIINCIHDEIVIECAAKDAKKYQPVFDQCMIAAGEVYIKDLPCLVESEIMDRWSK